MNQEDVLEILSTAPIFNSVSVSHLKEIMAISAVKNYQKDDIILDEDWLNNFLYIVLDGTFDVLLPQDSKVKMRLDSTVFATLERGACIGEYSFVDRKSTSARVQAKSDACVLAIPFARLESLLNNDHLVGKLIYRNLLSIVIARARNANDIADMYLPNDSFS